MQLRVLLAEDHNVVRQGLRRLLNDQSDLDMVGEAKDGLQAVEKVVKHRPDVLVLDLMLPGLGGLEVLERVQKRCRRTRVLMLSMYAQKEYVLKALDLGASGYVTKSADLQELLRAVREVGAGRKYLSESIEDLQLELVQIKAAGRSIDSHLGLTPRQKEVLQLIAEGLTNKEVAARLGNQERTVETHRAKLMRKLGCKNLAEVVRFALEWGLLERRKPPPEPSGQEPPWRASRPDRPPSAPA